MELDIRAIGGVATFCDPAFLQDDHARFVALAHGYIINIINLVDGSIIGRYEGHQSIVSSIVIFRGNEVNEYELLSSSMDGNLHLWNFTLSKIAVLNTWTMEFPICKILCSSADKDKRLDELKQVYLSTDCTGKKQVVSFDVKTGTVNQTDVQLSSDLLRFMTINVGSNGANSSLPVFVFADKEGCLSFAFWRCGQLITCEYNLSGRFVCVAVNDKSGSIACGKESGEIVVLHNVAEFLRQYFDKNISNENLITISVLHWHAHAVLDLAFTADARHLLSGGEESVLVVWNLSKSTKSFLPRLGAPLCKIVPCLSTTSNAIIMTLDNTVRFVNLANMEVEFMWEAIYIAHTKKKSVHHAAQGTLDKFQPNRCLDLLSDARWACIAKEDPRTGLAVLNGNPGNLQFLDLQSRALSKVHKVLNFQRLSKKDTAAKVYLPTVSLFAFDSTGNVLITFDVRRYDDDSASYSLKFWLYNQSKDEFAISSQMDDPHGKCALTVIDVKNGRWESGLENIGELKCATGCEDGVVKFWRCSALSNPGDLKSWRLKWQCSHSFQYRNCPIHSLQLSTDTSTVVVAHQNHITCWNPETMALKKSLTLFPTVPVQFMGIIEPKKLQDFGGSCGDAFLVISSAQFLCAYSLLTFEELWRLDMHCVSCTVAQDDHHVICQDGTLDLSQQGWIAVAYKSEANATETKLRIFSPISNQPILERSVKQQIISLAFLRNKSPLHSQGGLVAVTSDADVVFVTPKSDESKEPNRSKKVARVKTASLPAIDSERIRNLGDTNKNHGMRLRVASSASKVTQDGIVSLNSEDLPLDVSSVATSFLCTLLGHEESKKRTVSAQENLRASQATPETVEKAHVHGDTRCKSYQIDSALLALQNDLSVFSRTKNSAEILIDSNSKIPTASTKKRRVGSA